MDINLVHRLQVTQVVFNTLLSVTPLDGHSLGDGKVTLATSPLCLQSKAHEELSLHLIHSPDFTVVLDFPWLNCHSPLIDYMTRCIREWGPTCHAICLFSSPTPFPPEPLDPAELSRVPTEYVDLRELFSKR